MIIGGANKVAVLTVPGNVWNGMTPQAQMLFAMQQMLGFMASEYFADMEGMEIRVVDPTLPTGQKSVIQIGTKGK